MQANAIKILSGAVVGLLVSATAVAAGEEGSVEERIKPIGSVVVASPAPASQPEAAASQPEAAASQPEAAASQPEAAASQPEAAASQPEAAASQPGEAMSGMTGAGAAPAGGDGQALAQASGCLACHQVDAKLVGPSFTEIAAKYKGDAAAREMLIEKVKNGGVGTWGEVPMPPNAHVGVTQIAELVDWVLAL